MLRRVWISDGGVYVGARIEYEDTEARQILKDRGYKWDANNKYWESPWGEWEDSVELVRDLLAEGFTLFGDSPEDLAMYLARLGIIDTEISVAVLQSPTVPYEDRETRRFIFTAGTVEGGVQHGTMVRKNFRV